MDNYFNYFTEIEERFLRRRGGGLLLTTLDWALIETWKDAGIPLEAVLRGIDAAFDRYDERPSKTRKINSLAYCSQQVLSAAEDMKEAVIGAQPPLSTPQNAPGFEPQKIADFLERNADTLENANIPSSAGVKIFALECAASLRTIANAMRTQTLPLKLEELERRLTVLEEKMFAALLTAAPEDELVGIRAHADRELAPYRRSMAAPQIEQLQKQYVHKRLLEKSKLPRLSLFYM